MGKRGPKPKGNIKIEWSADFAYAIGLLVTDGCLYNDGRHINLVSKDIEQINNFIKCLGVKNNKIGVSKSSKGHVAFRIQFCDVIFYNFLINIGLMPAKSKILTEIKDIPNEHFFDFVRGLFDGDGCINSYFDPRWKSSFMFYAGFSSASPVFLIWLQMQIFKFLGIKGSISSSKNHFCQQLRYAKKESLVLIEAMYKNNPQMCLSRKKLKIMSILAMMGEPRNQMLTV